MPAPLGGGQLGWGGWRWGYVPFAGDFGEVARWDAASQCSVERVVQRAYAPPRLCGRTQRSIEVICLCRLSAEAEVLVQCRHEGVNELPQLAGRQLGALCDIRRIEGEQVGSGDEGPVERGQQVREGPRLEVGQHLQQVRHGIFTRAAVLMGAALRKGLARAA